MDHVILRVVRFVVWTGLGGDYHVGKVGGAGLQVPPEIHHWGSRDGSVGSAFDCEPMCCRFESSRG